MFFIRSRTTAFPTKLGKCSFYVVVLQRTAEKPTRLYFARAVSLFYLTTLLFDKVLHDAAVVVFLNFLIRSAPLKTDKKRLFMA